MQQVQELIQILFVTAKGDGLKPYTYEVVSNNHATDIL